MATKPPTRDGLKWVDETRNGWKWEHHTQKLSSNPQHHSLQGTMQFCFNRKNKSLWVKTRHTLTAQKTGGNAGCLQVGLINHQFIWQVIVTWMIITMFYIVLQHPIPFSGDASHGPMDFFRSQEPIFDFSGILQASVHPRTFAMENHHV